MNCYENKKHIFDLKKIKDKLRIQFIQYMHKHKLSFSWIKLILVQHRDFVKHQHRYKKKLQLFMLKDHCNDV